MADISIPWKKITRGLPNARQSANDRAPTIDEIRRLLDYPDRRIKPNDPPLAGSSKWHTIKYETKRFRDPSRKRKWRVEHSDRDKGYDIIPGSDDGIATSSPDWPFPRGDLWFLRYRGTEIDDGSIAVGPPYGAELDRFINGESLKGKDVVVWYSGHFTHDVSSEPAGSHGHVVGPKLVPVEW